MTAIRLGLHLHPPPRHSLESFIDTVKRADRYGFARLGTGDTQWPAMECFTALTLMALNSKKAEIGPRVTNPATREPSVTASAIASLEIVSQGRVVLGIGRGDSVFAPKGGSISNKAAATNKAPPGDEKRPALQVCARMS